MISIIPLQMDAISEFFNIGLGLAANKLSEITGEEINMMIPQANILEQEGFLKNIKEKNQGTVVEILQEYSAQDERIEGRIIFPWVSAVELISMTLKTDSDLISQKILLSSEKEAITEIGNTILNACLSPVSQLLGKKLKSGKPKFHLGSPNAVLAFTKTNKQKYFVIQLSINFNIRESCMDVVIAFVLNDQSKRSLIKQVDKFIASIPKQTA